MSHDKKICVIGLGYVGLRVAVCFAKDAHVIGFDISDNLTNLISGSSAFSKTSLNIWKFIVHILLKPCLENFEHYFTSV